MLGTGNGPVGTRFSLILGTRLAILGTRIGSLKHLKKMITVKNSISFLFIIFLMNKARYDVNFVLLY